MKMRIKMALRFFEMIMEQRHKQVDGDVIGVEFLVGSHGVTMRPMLPIGNDVTYEDATFEDAETVSIAAVGNTLQFHRRNYCIIINDAKSIRIIEV